MMSSQTAPTEGRARSGTQKFYIEQIFTLPCRPGRSTGIQKFYVEQKHDSIGSLSLPGEGWGEVVDNTEEMDPRSESGTTRRRI